MIRSTIPFLFLATIIHGASHSLDDILGRDLQFAMDVCTLYTSMADSVPENLRDNCLCNETLKCNVKDYCETDEDTGETGCIKSGVVNVSGTFDELEISSCVDSETGGYEEICSKMVGDATKWKSCDLMTYGGKVCEVCEPCVPAEEDDGETMSGLSIDCSKHNVNATTDGCFKFSLMEIFTEGEFPDIGKFFDSSGSATSDATEEKVSAPPVAAPVEKEDGSGAVVQQMSILVTLLASLAYLF